MSRSNQSGSSNPATRYFEWKGSDGVVSYYDKESSKNVDVALPFSFLVLDRVAQIAGGIDTNGGYLGYWSNAVKDLKKEQFTVKSKNGVVCKGLYAQIKNQIGIKFATGLYIAYAGDDGEMLIGYLTLKGAALTSWINFTSKHKNIFIGEFSITGNVAKKKGATKYFEPVFSHTDVVSDETNASAIALDKELQAFLTTYFAGNNQSVPDDDAYPEPEFSQDQEADSRPDDFDSEAIPF